MLPTWTPPFRGSDRTRFSRRHSKTSLAHLAKQLGFGYHQLRSHNFFRSVWKTSISGGSDVSREMEDEFGIKLPARCSYEAPTIVEFTGFLGGAWPSGCRPLRSVIRWDPAFFTSV